MMKRKFLAILLSLAMLFTLLPPGAALAASPSYVALGDSITTGYGLSADNNVETNKSLSFAAQVATNNNFALNNLAEDGETSASLLDKLTKSDDPDYETVTEAVKSADVITITIGGNDLMDALYEYLAASYNTTHPDAPTTAEQIKAMLTGQDGAVDFWTLTSLITPLTQFPASSEFTTALNRFSTNLSSIVSQIKSLNANVRIVVATQYNPYSHLSNQTIDGVVSAFDNGIQQLNGKISSQTDIKVADVYTAFSSQNASENPLCNASFSMDTGNININLDFHPNAKGHEVIADVVGEAVKGVTDVTVTPQQIVLAPGKSANFSADVSTIGPNINQAVTWTVSGNKSNSTTIVDGKLTIGFDEESTTLTVTATSNYDTSKSGTATVTVGQKAEIYVGGVGLNGTPEQPAYATTDDNGNVSTDGANASNYNIKWDGATLTLNNATIKTGSRISEDAGMTAIYREASLDIVLQGANTVVSPAVGSEMSTGIYAGPADMQTATQKSYGITISGDGSLDVSGSNAEDSSIGIGAMMGDVTIESGTVTAHGGATNGGNSAGIMTSAGDVIIHNGTVTATSGAAGDASAGIFAIYGNVIISGGTVTATGGAASDASAGIFAHGLQDDAINMGGNVTISSGEVTAVAENGAGITAMVMSQDLSAPLGTVTISPAAGQQIAVRAGADETDAAEIAGSPFTAATAIQSLIQNDAYVHTKAEQAPVTEYTITFDANGGSVNPASAETTDGKLVSLPTPGYAGHIFQGWFTAATGGTQVTTDTVFTADATIYAQWKAESSTPSTPTGPSKPVEPDGPATEDSEGWSAIEDELALADDGDDIAVDMNGATEVPKEVFERVVGKDVDVTFELEDGVSWSVNGADIPTDADLSDLDLAVTMDSDGIPVDVIDTVTSESSTTVQMTLAHDGAFGFTMTLSAPLGKENAGLWANLYHYDENAKAMTFETATLIDDDGNAALPMRHASQYAIVIDDHSHAAEAALPFSDVNDDDWFFDVVRYVYEQGLMTGTSDREFSPNLTTTRGMIVSILNRLENGPTAEAAGFTDVADGDWYAEAVNWAAREGIVAGYEDNTFRPNDPITREQLAAMLMNYAAWKGEDVSARADLSGYNDAASVSSWAAETVQWAVADGLISGMPGNLLEPQGSATRAQVAAILQRFLSD